MKLLEHFRSFLNEHVNLNKTRIDLLEASVEAVKSAVRNADWGPEVHSFAAQGSWAHKTIIKPQPGDEFDADLLAFVKRKDGWEPKDYINKLALALESSATYRGKVRRFSHCVTIEYRGERRIDVAPCVKNRQYEGQFEVCNRVSNQFEQSEPVKYTEWVVAKNLVAGGNDLKKVARLLKYMRDIKGNFTCPRNRGRTLPDLSVLQIIQLTAFEFALLAMVWVVLYLHVSPRRIQKRVSQKDNSAILSRGC